MDDKITPPTIHRMEGELMVCDPEKTDQTRDIESWRIFKIMAEFVDGFQLLRKYRLAATFFGSARSNLDEKIFADAVTLSGKLAGSGFAIMTGGASGIMEAASQGAYEAGGQSVGLNIRLPMEQGVNHYLTDGLTFNYFFTRKVMLAFASEAYIFFPGGFGTLDEFFEILTLVQTNKVKRIPIILYGTEFWGPLIQFFKNSLLEKYKTIDKADLELFTLVDTVDDAYEAVVKLVKC